MSILLIRGDARAIPLADQSVHCVVTSPPYWNLRNYNTHGQLGLEKTPEDYVAVMVDVFREVRRVLRDDGTLWLNMGDSYCSGTSTARTRETPETRIARKLPRNWFIGANKIDRNGTPPGWKPKDLVPTSWMLALALRADGWYLRSDIIWSKGNPMPETVKDRPTRAHEYIFLLTKSSRYYYDAEAIKEEVTGEAHSRSKRNKRSVWEVNPQPFPEAHFATFPEELIKPCILAGCPAGGIVLDPFVGSGTTLLVARNLQCHGIGLELNEAYLRIAKRRLRQEVLDFQEVNG